jgi:hypothetical protein
MVMRCHMNFFFSFTFLLNIKRIRELSVQKREDLIMSKLTVLK